MKPSSKPTLGDTVFSIWFPESGILVLFSGLVQNTR